jgi:hypothetical protein
MQRTDESGFSTSSGKSRYVTGGSGFSTSSGKSRYVTGGSGFSTSSGKSRYVTGGSGFSTSSGKSRYVTGGGGFSTSSGKSRYVTGGNVSENAVTCSVCISPIGGESFVTFPCKCTGNILHKSCYQESIKYALFGCPICKVIDTSLCPDILIDVSMFPKHNTLFDTNSVKVLEQIAGLRKEAGLVWKQHIKNENDNAQTNKSTNKYKKELHRLKMSLNFVFDESEYKSVLHGLYRVLDYRTTPTGPNFVDIRYRKGESAFTAADDALNMYAKIWTYYGYRHIIQDGLQVPTWTIDVYKEMFHKYYESVLKIIKLIDANDPRIIEFDSIESKECQSCIPFKFPNIWDKSKQNSKNN